MMRGIGSLLLAAAAVIGGGSVMAAPENTADYYVAANGRDSWSGTLAAPNAGGTDGPFATPMRARDAVRAKIAAGLKQPVTVLVREGTYFLPETLLLGPQDSGTAECPVTYAAYPGERPVLSGGRPVTGWRRGDGGAWVADLPEVREGKWTFRQLFVSRPGQGYYERRFRPILGPFIIGGLTDAPAREGMGHRRSQDEFRFRPGDIQEWEGLEDVEVVALHDWSASRLRIRELDMQERVVRFTGFPIYRIGAWYEGGRNPYTVENVKAALGKPGEWYLDRKSGRLSYIPKPGEEMETLTVVAPAVDRLVRLAGDADTGAFAEHIRFRGLSFCHTNWSLPGKGYSAGQGMVDLPAAVAAAGARDCRFEGCTFAHLGAYALDLGAGCHDNAVVGCLMSDLGAGGVKVGVTGATAVPPVLPTGNVVENNLISDGGIDHFSPHGVWIGIAERTRVAHNVIRRFPYSNVSVGWKWDDTPTSCKGNVIEFNHIHDSMMLLADGGGIYSLGFQPGTVMRGNLIHDVHRSEFAGRAPNNGIFFDQGSKEYLVEGNVIYNTSGKPLRYNQCQEAWHTFRDNALDVKPDDPAYPKERAAAAGLQPAYQGLLDQAFPVALAPILSMKLPPPGPPIPVNDGFESDAVGAVPAGARAQGETAEATIRVTEEAAASGKRSVKFTDAPGTAKPFYPYLQYLPSFIEGTARVRFALRVEPGMHLWVEGRHTRAGGYLAGPSLHLGPGGKLVAEKQLLTTVPEGEWLRFELTCALGDRATGTYDLAVTLPDGKVERFEKLPLVSADFKQLSWLGFITPDAKPGVFYLDDVELSCE